MLVFLYLNGFKLDQTDDEIYQAFLNIAASDWSQADFFNWVEGHIQPEDQIADSAVQQ